MLAEAQGNPRAPIRHARFAIGITITKPPATQAANRARKRLRQLVPPLLPRHPRRVGLLAQPPPRITLVHGITPHGGHARPRRADALSRRNTLGAY